MAEWYATDVGQPLVAPGSGTVASYLAYLPKVSRDPDFVAICTSALQCLIFTSISSETLVTICSLLSGQTQTLVKQSVSSLWHHAIASMRLIMR